MSMLWPWLLLLVAVYCVVQIVRDYRAKNYTMAIVGIFCLILLLFTPLQSHAVKLDIPIAS